MTPETLAHPDRYELSPELMEGRAGLHRRIAYMILGLIIIIITAGMIYFRYAEKLLGSEPVLDELTARLAEQEVLIGKKLEERKPLTLVLFNTLRAALEGYDEHEVSAQDGERPYRIDGATGATLLSVDGCPSAESAAFTPELFYEGESVLAPRQLSSSDCRIVAEALEAMDEFSKVKINQDEVFALEEGRQILRTEVIRLRALGGGEESSKSSAAVGPELRWIQLVENSINRLGILVMLFFLVSILVPIYRYNLRLSVFYEGVADALKAVGRMPTSAETLGVVAETLTPGFDFSKQPRSPVVELAGMATQMKGR